MAIFGEEKQGTKLVNKFLDWNGKEGYFTYYDKQAEEKKSYDLGQFIILKQGFNVKGFSQKYQKGLYSNEIEDIINEDLYIKVFENGTVLSGKYNDIKDKIIQGGGKLHKAVTVLTDDGELVEFFVKGKAFYEINQFLNDVNIQKNKIKFTGAKEEKTGAVKYYIPEFDVGDEITDQEKTNAKTQAYKLRNNTQDKQEETNEDNTAGKQDEELPF